MTDTEPPVLLPPQFETPRLILRPPTAQDAAAVNAATCASFAELQPFMDWAIAPPTLAASAAFCATGSRELQAQGACPLLMFRRSNGLLLGGTGFASYDLAVPKFELGYWCLTSATGNGYVSEAVVAQCRYLFEALQAQRIELRMDDRNVASYAVAERLGFTLEATLVNDARGNDGTLRDTRVYALYALPSAWEQGSRYPR